MNKPLRAICLLVLFLMPAIGTTAVPAMGQDVIKIGAIYSLTGPAAAGARLQQQATELAMKEVNEAGGINLGDKKMKLEVIFADDLSKPDTAASLSQTW
jgi:branched-chain amino acid transport system substrate-binding protein